MTNQTTWATCELGFWKQETRGCPVCGPDGPCVRMPKVAMTVGELIELLRAFPADAPVYGRHPPSVGFRAVPQDNGDVLLVEGGVRIEPEMGGAS